MGTFKIQTSTSSEDLFYKIFTPNGSVVQSGKLESNEIDLGTEPGIYFIQLSNGKQFLTRKIIVQ